MTSVNKDFIIDEKPFYILHPSKVYDRIPFIVCHEGEAEARRVKTCMNAHYYKCWMPRTEKLKNVLR